MPETKKKDSMMCQCGCGCGPWGHAWLRLVRAIFAVVILIIVFVLGLKIGELRGLLESRMGYGDHVMNMHYPMMQSGMGAMGTTTATSSGQ